MYKLYLFYIVPLQWSLFLWTVRSTGLGHSRPSAVEPDSSRALCEGASLWALEPQCTPWRQLQGGMSSGCVHSGDPLVLSTLVSSSGKEDEEAQKCQPCSWTLTPLRATVPCINWWGVCTPLWTLVFQLWIPLFSSRSPLPHPSSPCAHTRIMFIVTAIFINLSSWTVYTGLACLL